MSTKPKRSVDYYLPAEFPAAAGLTNGENAIHVSVDYNEGGPNYFSGGMTPRGYSVSVSGVKREDGCTSFIIGGGNFGRRYRLMPAARFNAKTLAAIDAAILPLHAQIVALALTLDHAGIAALLANEMTGGAQKIA